MVKEKEARSFKSTVGQRTQGRINCGVKLKIFLFWT